MKALVTGARGGIGSALCARLVTLGYEVEALDLPEFDVSDPAAWERVGPVDLAFLNAGVTTGTGDVLELTDEAYRRAVGVNVDGVVFGVRRLARVMDGGSIVVTASLAGLTDISIDPVYGLTKHAVIGFVRSVAPQLEPRINAVCPGMADTPMLDEAARADLGDFPLLRPDDVVDAMLVAAQSSETGGAWVVQPGREPLAFRFPGIPGPRVEGAEGLRPWV